MPSLVGSVEHLQLEGAESNLEMACQCAKTDWFQVINKKTRDVRAFVRHVRNLAASKTNWVPKPILRKQISVFFKLLRWQQPSKIVVRCSTSLWCVLDRANQTPLRLMKHVKDMKCMTHVGMLISPSLSLSWNPVDMDSFWWFRYWQVDWNRVYRRESGAAVCVHGCPLSINVVGFVAKVERDAGYWIHLSRVYWPFSLTQVDGVLHGSHLKFLGYGWIWQFCKSFQTLGRKDIHVERHHDPEATAMLSQLPSSETSGSRLKQQLTWGK